MKMIHACVISLMSFAACCVEAQDFPSKPVKLIVPLPPGGPLDVAGRMISRELQERWAD